MSAVWSLDLSVLRVAAAVALVLISLALSVRQWGRGGRRRAEAAFEFVRLLAVLLLAITLLRPERVQLVPEEGRPGLAVLLDATGSMATLDETGPDGILSRAAALEQWAARPDTWAGLDERFRLRIEPFGAPPEDPAAAATSGTDLHTALESAARGERAIRAVMLFSDGDWNAGSPPMLAAARLQAAGIPLYTVVLGRDRPLPDLELESLRAPAYAPLGQPVQLPFVLRSRMPESARVTVTLSEGGVERARRTVDVPAMAQEASSLRFVPDAEGERVYTLRADPLPGESRTDNNERTFRMAVRSQSIRVLIVDSLPRWEYRYLRNAARRDPAVEAHTLLLHPNLPPGGGPGYLTAFPATREEVSTYDLVVLGDIGIGEGGLTEEQAGWIRDLVESQAGGLVLLPGDSGRFASLADSPLGPLFPVELDPERPRGHGLSVESRLALTARGRDHLLTLLADTPEWNERVWSALPGFFWYAGVRSVRPGADVLAVHAQARNEEGRIPLLVTRSAGSGQVLFLGMDAAWRWRRGVEDRYHYRFWGQVFRWMAHARHLAQAEGLRFFFTPETPSVGDRLFVQATPLDARGFPLAEATVEATLRAPSGGEQRARLRPVDGAWGAWQGALRLAEGGEHRLEVLCRETGATVAVTLWAHTPELEAVGRPARPDVLRELARVTGGGHGRLEDADRLVAEVRALPDRAPRETRLRLWTHPLWLAAWAGLLGVYWVGRKMLGRV
jgi:hypothetical protein